MSNFTGFVYGATISALERQQKPLSEEEIILQARAAEPGQEKPGLARRVRDMVRQSLDRLNSPAKEPALERVTSQH